MKKRRIVIASVLKPVDDTRMFEKMGSALSDTGRYEVFILGYPSKSIPVYTNITFLSLPLFSRLSLGRLLAPWKILRMTNQVKPDILIVNTHELLFVAILNRILFGARIIYDIRENYFRNILYADTFPTWLRPLLACWVRLKEILTAPFFQSFLLGETGYQTEMHFFSRHAAVVQNKANVSPAMRRSQEPGKIRLLFSGTLAVSTGVFEAIDLAKKLHNVNPTVQLTLLGYCAKPDILRKIRSAIDDSSFIELHGGDSLVPHGQIMRAIFESDFGIVYYPPSPQTENSVPTKLYEYLACRLPLLLEARQRWVALCTPSQACISIDFSAPNPAGILQKMKGPFYVSEPEDVTWDSESTRFLAAVEGRK